MTMILSKPDPGTGKSTHLIDVLRHYRSHEAADNWLSATVVTKYRSSYRQPGAMMLISPLGQSFGLISGGCLETNIQLQARKVQALGYPLCLVYDTFDEDNIAAELDLGCNGRVEVLIQELTGCHRKVLLTLLQRMEAGQTSYVMLCFASENQDDLKQMVLLDHNRAVRLAATGAPLPDLAGLSDARHQLLEEGGRDWSISRCPPPVNFWVFGGGIDARPMVTMAAQLAWQVTLVDHRITHAREQNFPSATAILRHHPGEFTGEIDADAAVLMSHNLKTDAAWLRRLQRCESLRYLGLLGPIDRRREVIELAEVNPLSDFAQSVHGPMGFDIGGDLPEAIALSTLAQCHQIIHSRELRRSAISENSDPDFSRSRAAGKLGPT